MKDKRIVRSDTKQIVGFKMKKKRTTERKKRVEVFDQTIT